LRTAHPYHEHAGHRCPGGGGSRRYGRDREPAHAPEPEKVLPTMTTAAAPALSLLAEGGNHDSLNPVLTGGGALFALLVLLFIATRFNRDR
jgi:hypothetical protein